MSGMLEPDREADVAAIVTDAFARRARLAISGGNTKQAFGHPVAADSAVSLARLSGILAYDPAEMVLTAKAGTSLAEIEAALAAQGQMLAFEPPDYRPILGSSGEPTIGGLFACNLSGPRRFVAGAARDSLIGVRFVNGQGQVIRSGGRVMKNVTGLDVVKLMAGSFGTLGVMTDVTMKLLPRPADTVTLALAGPDDEAACRIMSAMMATSLDISGAAYLPESCRRHFAAVSDADGGVVAFRLEGHAFSVAERAGRLESLLAPHGTIRRLDRDASGSLWGDIRDVRPFRDTAKALWKVSIAPAAGAALINALRMQTGVDGFLDWQGGLLWLQMEAGAEAEIVRAELARLGGGHATLVRASLADRNAVPVFEPHPPVLAALEGRVRASLDPAGILNPGRMG